MCGRYSLFLDEDIAELQRIVRETEGKLQGKAVLKTEEIYPTNTAPILMGSSLSPEPAAWGFPGFKGSGVVINARAETAAEKRMFAESLVARRCVIPSTGFYEWKKEGREKRKYLFRIPEKKLLYMAGLYKEFQGEGAGALPPNGATGTGGDCRQTQGQHLYTGIPQMHKNCCKPHAGLSAPLRLPRLETFVFEYSTNVPQMKAKNTGCFTIFSDY